MSERYIGSGYRPDPEISWRGALRWGLIVAIFIGAAVSIDWLFPDRGVWTLYTIPWLIQSIAEIRNPQRRFNAPLDATGRRNVRIHAAASIASMGAIVLAWALDFSFLGLIFVFAGMLLCTVAASRLWPVPRVEDVEGNEPFLPNAIAYVAAFGGVFLMVFWLGTIL